jgi:hypothetical protein
VHRTTRHRAPELDVQQITERGSKALALALANRARLEPRLDPSTIDGLAADLTALGTVVPDAAGARQSKKAATAAERQSAEALTRRIVAISDLVRHRHAGNAEALKAWGVGKAIAPQSTTQVLSRGRLLVSRARAVPAEARAAGVLEADITAIAAALTALDAANTTQGAASRDAETNTRTRDETLRRVHLTTRNIALAARVEFHDQPALVEQFETLLGPRDPMRRPARGAAPTRGGTPPSGGATS